MVEIRQEDLKEWLKEKDTWIEKYYAEYPDQKPSYYESNLDAHNALKVAKIQLVEAKKAEKINKGKSTSAADEILTLGEAAELIVKNIATVIVETADGEQLAIYDYNRKIYTYQVDTILNEYVVMLLGSSSTKILNDIVLTMRGMKQYISKYNPLPKYKVAVGNGIFNCITGEREPYNPMHTVLTKIDTDYVKDAKPPVYPDGFTLDKMISDLSNNNPQRERLLKQITKTIILGYSIQDAIFIIIGQGGDGKSTYFSLISNILGYKNVSNINFTELSSDDKIVTALNKKLAIGFDNDDNVFVQKTSLIKTMASKEPMTFSRKYLSAISAPFLASFVQLVNTFPRFKGGGHAISRRLVTFKVEKSHTLNNTVNRNIDSVYIHDRRFLEYALWYFLTEEMTPYYNKYNEIDAEVTDESLYADDMVGQFVHTLVALDIIGKTNQMLPITHLYAAYQDFIKENSPATPLMSSRTFAKEIEGKLVSFGYKRVQSDYTVRPKTLERNGTYNPDAWSYYLEYYNLPRVIETNSTSRVFERVGDVFKPTHKAEPEVRISPVRYFRLDTEIKQTLGVDTREEITFENEQKMTQILSEEIENKPPEEHSLDDAPIDIVGFAKELRKHLLTPLGKDRETSEYKESVNALYQEFNQYRAWLTHLAENKDIDLPRYDMLMDNAQSKWEQVVPTLGDITLSLRVDNLKIKRNDMSEMIDELLDYIKERHLDKL